MKVDTKKIEWLLNHATAYRISKISGVAQPTITNIINGKRKLENLTVTTGHKLTQAAEKLQEGNKKMKHTEQEILDIIKDLEFEPDLLDIWEDKDGNISIEARGMAPADERERGFKEIGYVDNGNVVFD